MGNIALEFGAHYQRAVLSRILQDIRFATESISVIDNKYFDTEPLKWICNKIKFEGVKTFAILVSELKIESKKGNINDDLRTAIASDMQHMLKKKEFDNADYGIKKLKEFINVQKLSVGLFKAATDLEKGISSVDIRRGLSGIIVDEFDNATETVNLFNDKENRFKEREAKVRSGQLKFYLTGIKSLDDDIKGPMSGQMWSFFGDTNIGKSVLAVVMGRANVLSGNRVWHVSIEDLFEMTKQRYDAALTKTSYDSLTFCNYTKEQLDKIDKTYELLKKKRDEYIYVSKLEEGCSMDDIMEEHFRIKTLYNFNPEVIIIDSPHCMEPAMQKKEMRLQAKQIYSEIRKFARKEKPAIMLLDQKKFEKDKKQASGTDAFSESYDKARIADGFITINQNRVQQKDGILEYYIAKMKDRKKHISYFSRSHFEVMRLETISEN